MKTLVVEVTRGSLVESVHRIAACASDTRGNRTFEIGDPSEYVYLRSAAKPIIAAAIVRAGVAERFGLTEQEIAVITGSHFGAPIHVAAAESILAKIGLDRSALLCGASFPGDEQTLATMRREGSAPEAIYNNCSGKHAGILALTVARGADIRTYRDLDHPVEREINAMYERVFGLREEECTFGVDGCGIPVIAMPLRNAAMGFARLASPESLGEGDARALARVRDAMIAYPEYVRANDDFNTLLMQAAHGRVVAKGGAEGVFCFGDSERGIGCIVKAADGNMRAIPPAIVACLDALDIPIDKDFRDRFSKPPIYNVSGDVVGHVVAVVT